MNWNLTFLLGALAVSATLCACSQRTAQDQTINSSATLASTNDTLRVNQPRAFQRSETIVASGTNLQIAEAAGASTSPSEATVARQIKTALETDPTLMPLASAIKVVARNGKIILTGSVPTDAQRLSVIEKAREIAGENKVDDRLQVQSNPDLTPAPDVQKQENP